ncbi:hypothetical protein ACQKJZ_17220, partial [Sphingomonas sp. NPDC019816]|uniref:hypothetical protein n=1 Tax=Sphingomonas sp. NPDC019816 TaxID=3390679 RepID=UPI003D020BDA
MSASAGRMAQLITTQPALCITDPARKDTMAVTPKTRKSFWTCPGKVESSLEVKGELDDEAATFHEGIRGG